MPGPLRRRRNRMHRENSARVAGEDSRPFFTPPRWARLALRFCIVTELRGDQPAKNAVPFDAQKLKTDHTQEMYFCNKARWAACGRRRRRRGKSRRTSAMRGGPLFPSLRGATRRSNPVAIILCSILCFGLLRGALHRAREICHRGAHLRDPLAFLARHDEEMDYFLLFGLWPAGVLPAANGLTGAGPPFLRFLSAFGFFFSLLLRICPLAMTISLRPVETLGASRQ